MSKIKLEAPFRQFRGKICKHSDIIFKQMYGETFTSQICNPRTKPYSQAELDRQDLFRQAAAATKTVLDLLHSLGVEDDMIMFDNFGG